MCAVAQGEAIDFPRVGVKPNIPRGEIVDYVNLDPKKKITKENIIKEIKELCFGDEYRGISTICSFSLTMIRENSLGEKEEVAFYSHHSFYIKSFAEVERILQELSTFKVPQDTQLSIYQRAIKTIVQDIYKDIQKVYNDKSDYGVEASKAFFELVKNYKTLTAKYTNTPITQAMINALKTSAQQQYNALVKLEKQREELEEQQRKEIQSRSEIQALNAKLKPLYDKRFELMQLRLQSNGKIDSEKFREEYDLIDEKINELYKELPEIPKPQGSPELDAQIAAKEVELSLLVQEIGFLEMQREIQKVEKMSQAQLTQYVIQHSVCNKKHLENPEEQYGQCVDREYIIADAKNGWYDPEYLFNPFYPERAIRSLGVWEDEEGNLWTEDEFKDRYNLIVKRAFALNDIAQALKNNNMQKLYHSLINFGQFAKNKERDFLSQLIEQIETHL